MKKKKSVTYWLKEMAIFIVIVTVFAVGMDWWRKQDMPIDVALPITAATITGAQIDLLEMSNNKPVIVYFWATWCGACKFVTPTINWLSDSYQVVGVPIRSGEPARVSTYIAAHDYRFINVNDPQGEISNQWGVAVTPTIVIIKNGNIKSITTGLTTPWGLLARLWLA